MTKTPTMMPSTSLSSSTDATTSTPPMSMAEVEVEGDIDDTNGDASRDCRYQHIWVVEPKDIRRRNASSSSSSPPPPPHVLTNAGVYNIVHHQYQAGDYTVLDRLLNPIWTSLTEWLPLWVAPNLVTTFGGCFCFVSWILSIYYLNRRPQEEGDDDVDVIIIIPRWLYYWNGFALLAYYTLDCMDGKQARRTQSSSPLGQLFDHGMDGLCNVSHVQAIQCIVIVPSTLLLVLQCTLQCAFFQAQWEEYYTGQLPHATGDYCGVTEVLYGMAVWSLCTGLIGRDVYDIVLWQANDIIHKSNNNQSNIGTTLIGWLTGGTGIIQIRHVASLGWVCMIGGLIVLSLRRVYRHVDNLPIFLSAVSKLCFGPWLLMGMGLIIVTIDTNHSSSTSTSSSTSVLPSILFLFALGMAYVTLTVRIIVYSMAKMAYASIQWDVMVVMGLYVLWRTTDFPSMTSLSLFGVGGNAWWEPNVIITTILAIYYTASFVRFSYLAITQLCAELQIELFRIPHHQSKDDVSKKEK